MAESYVEYTGNGATTNRAVSFPYLDQDHVSVTVDGVDTAFTWVNSSTISISPAPANGTLIRISRNSSRDERLVDWVVPSTVGEEELDLDSKQAFYMAQEAFDRSDRSILLDDAEGQWDAQDKRIINLADPVDDQDAATKAYVVDQTADSVVAAAASAAAAASSASSASSSASTATTQASNAYTSATNAASSAAAAAESAASIANPLPVTSGGTGRQTGATAYGLLAAGITATGAHQTLAPGTSGDILVSGGSGALPAFTTPTGTGAPVRAGSPTFTGTVSAATIAATEVISTAQSFAATGQVQTHAASKITIAQESPSASVITAYGADSTTPGNLFLNTREADGTSGGGTVCVGLSKSYAGTQAFDVHKDTTDYLVTLGNSNASLPYGLYIKYTAASPNGTVNYFLDCRDGGGTVRAQLYSNGGLANYSANNVNLSDIRTKDVFEDYTPELLDELEQKFCAIRRGRFKYNDQTHDDWNYGKSAQSVAEQMPELSGIWNPTTRISELVPYERLVEKEYGLEFERGVEVQWRVVETPEDKQLICEYPHDIAQIGEALLVRALKKIADLERRVAELEKAQ